MPVRRPAAVPRPTRRSAGTAPAAGRRACRSRVRGLRGATAPHEARARRDRAWSTPTSPHANPSAGTARCKCRTGHESNGPRRPCPDDRGRLAWTDMDETGQTVASTLTRFDATADVDQIHAAIERDGAVIIEGLLGDDVVSRVNDEVGGALDRADPDDEMFHPVMKDFHGPFTRQVSGVPGISPTFAVDVMCHPLLLALADRILLPSCARYQLNLGHLLQRGPGSDEQILHRDELVWSDVPHPHPELQLATVIAFVDFTRENGATRVVPGSHRWPDRQLSAIEQLLGDPPKPEQIAYAEMPAGSAVVYLGGTIHAGGANSTDIARRGAHLSYCLGWLRTEENNYLSIPPSVAAQLPRQAQEVLGYAVHDSIPRGGGYLGMVRMQDPVELLARGELGDGSGVSFNRVRSSGDERARHHL